MILNLLPYTHPTIHTRTQATDLRTIDVDKVERDLLDTMRAHGAYGLSGCQVGLDVRAAAVASEVGAVLWNPRVVDTSKETQVLEEGCLTYPGLLVKVERPRVVKIRYSDKRGDTQTKTFVNFTARVLLHEIDHLEGITILTALTGVKRDLYERKWQKLVKRNGPGPSKIRPTVLDTLPPAAYDLTTTIPHKLFV